MEEPGEGDNNGGSGTGKSGAYGDRSVIWGRRQE